MTKVSDFGLLMISAMYENGGNVTQRLLDGHPQLVSYPFESQLGTKYVQDHLTGLYPVKYRWPVLPLDGTPEADYEAIIDEECKVRLKTPQASKFRDTALSLRDPDRKAAFVRRMQEGPRSRAAVVAAFFAATAEAWSDRARSERERVFVGYSPIVGVDADKILADFPKAHVLNVVRHPFAAYADTKKRPVPLSLAHYATGWAVHQHHALAFRRLFPDRVHILRYEDIVRDPVGVLTAVLEKLGLEGAPTLSEPSWNGARLAHVRPWGTIDVPTAEVNAATARELDQREVTELLARTGPLLRELDYEPR